PAGGVLVVKAEQAHAVGGHHHHLLPCERRPPPPGTDNDSPVCGRVGSYRHVGAVEAHPFPPHLDHDVPVTRFFHDGIPCPAAEHVRHVVRTAGPAQGDSHRVVDPHDITFC